MRYVVSICILCGFLAVDAMAGPKNKYKGPAASYGGPPGLAKKGGLPPGIAKKYFAGHHLPRHIYVPLESRYFNRLPYKSQAGRQWVRVGRDVYLVALSTGIIIDVLHGWIH